MRKISISQHISSKLPVHICVDKIKGSLRAEFRSATTAMTEDAALNFLLIIQILMVRQILIFLNQQTVDVSFSLVSCSLFSAAAAISQEKAASEAKFLADKRRMRKEKEELVAQINSLKFSEDTLRYGAMKRVHRVNFYCSCSLVLCLIQICIIVADRDRMSKDDRKGSEAQCSGAGLFLTGSGFF